MAHFTERQARRQQRFSKIEDRNITVLLPQTSSQQEVPDASESDSAETEKDEDMQQHELQIVAQLWRDRMAHDDIERFETAASKKLRLLQASKAYSYVILRVRLPGGVFLQGRFNLQESLKVRVFHRKNNYCVRGCHWGTVQGMAFKLRRPPVRFWLIASLSISDHCFLSRSSYTPSCRPADTGLQDSFQWYHMMRAACSCSRSSTSPFSTVDATHPHVYLAFAHPLVYRLSTMWSGQALH